MVLPTHPTPLRQVAQLGYRYFIRTRYTTQAKKPIVNIANPTNAVICSGLASPSEKTVFGSMFSPVQPK
jgi:hypothetical protein